MIVDLMHNKIIAATVTEAFSGCFKEKLLPKLSEKYGDSITLVQMYEDHIADGFALGGEFYYPLTVVTDEARTEWIKWKLAKGKFEGNSPYAYVGDDLDFELVEKAPDGFEDKLSGRARFAEVGLVPIRVETTASDITFLSGKYSQTFIDEMARQLTPAIEEAMSVTGLSESGLELCLVFAPESYMEHTSENVTYRRLLLTDNSGAPRDFWIKWTRLDGATAYSVAANVSSSSILFEIGEDVSQKVREKEYRFLLSTKGKDKYHNAMGRKNITEWREIIKRAVRRGDLVKVEQAVTISKETEDLTKELLKVVGGVPAATEEVVASRESDEELARALEFARSALDAANGEQLIDEEEEDEQPEETDELDDFYSEGAEEPVTVSFDGEDEKEADELARLAKEELQSVRATEISFADEPSEEEISEEDPSEEDAEEFEELAEDDEIISEEFEEEIEEEIIEEETAEEEIIAEEIDPCAEEYPESEYSEIDDEEALEEGENDEALSELEELLGVTDEPSEKTVPSAAIPVEEKIDITKLEEKIRAEVEAKLRLEYEMNARKRAEEEAERLRKENEKLLMAAKGEEERKAERERARLEETEKLKSQIEAQLRAEARERERLAEAARAAVEEQRRLEEEKARIEAMRLEEQRRLEAEERAKALEEERRREAERIRRETEERIRAEYEEKERAEREERERLKVESDSETETSSSMASEASKDNFVNQNYTYISKNVKLLFRRSVDPNITARIHEIIKATLDYYGKSKVYLKIKATVPDTQTVILEFVKIPMEEMELLGNIIKVLGNSGLGIAKAIVD